jgi:hypothetical protein|tara:strand:- start:393 stop:746 length:354 start_codon:yes stop_codon:yes gene_type:complete
MPKITKRGRPSKEQSQNSSYCTIKDPLMEPFYISKDATNFTVIEKSISTRGFAGKKATGKEVEKVVGYYTSFRNALNKIAKEKFYNNSGEYSSIQDYINSWDEVKNGLETMLNKVKV